MLRDSDWQWPDWHFDSSNAVSKVELPESGGWLLKFRSGEGAYTHVFAPDLAKWTEAIAIAMATAKNAPIEVFLDLDSATSEKQPNPT